MRLIRTEDAAGHVLCHDMTQIIPGVTKDARFRKAMVVTEEDIPVLLSIGKEHLYVWEKTEGMLHEDEGAERLRRITQNENMHPSVVKEGKIELLADVDGLFQVDVERLYDVNSVDEIMIATRHTNTAVKKGDKLAGMRVIPLIIDEKRLEEAEKKAGPEPLLKVTPWKLKTAGVITTGSEVYKGLIKDQFTPIVEKKLETFGIQMTKHVLCSDDTKMITDAIAEMKEAGVDLIICTGGMSVDPDDKTPGAIKASGAEIVTYGAPTLPGAMLCLAYFEDDTPIVGLPGCVMYAKATVFDLILPRMAAGIKIERRDIIRMGHGGLCLGCKECHYPGLSIRKGGVKVEPSRVTLEEAQELFQICMPGIKKEEKPAADCLGQILAEPVYAAVTQPPFPRSAMDGFALRSRDVCGQILSIRLPWKLPGVCMRDKRQSLYWNHIRQSGS